MQELELTEKILSACSGSLLTSLLVTPLDVVKVRMQSQGSIKPRARAWVFHGDFPDNVEPFRASPTTAASSGRRICGTWDGLKYIVRNEGAHNLWRGLSPTLMMAVPATVVYFVGYEALRNRLGNGMAGPVLAGASARVLAATLISPLELVRTNMQHLGREGTVKAVLSQTLDACRLQGPGVLFKGLVPTLWRDVPFSALYWTCFEAGRIRLRPTLAKHIGPGPPLELTLSFVAGSLSGGLAAALTTPFDVAKTRTQISLSSPNVQQSPKRSMAWRLREIWRAEGIRGLTSGLWPRVFKVAPACGIMIGSYEFCKAFFVQART